MTLTIGRVSITQNPSQLELDGDRLDVGGWFFGTDLNHAKVIREQLIGLDGNEDEPDVPVTWSYDAKVDGYYTVKVVAVSHIMGVAYEDFKFQYAVQLERVQGGFALPVVEVSSSAVLRTNGVGATSAGGTAVGRLWIPSAASFRAARFSDGTVANVITVAGATRVTAVGSVVFGVFSPGVSPNFMSATSAALPANYYDGAATLEQSVGGVYYPVVGDQIGNVVGNLMRIGNGLVRATLHTDGAITTEVFDGSAWESPTAFSLRNAGTKLWTPEGGWKILRNDPAACAIRVSANFSTFNYPGSITLYLERGKRVVEVYVDNMFYNVDQIVHTQESLELRANTVTAATALTGGIRQTSNNAQGNRWVMLSASAVTNDLTNGRITIALQAAPLIAQFALGWELGGSASTNPDTVGEVVPEYFGVTGMRQRVVSK